MAETAASEPLYAINVSRKMHQLERLSLDIERVTRQYQIVGKVEVQELVLNYVERYQDNLTLLCSLLTLQAQCTANREHLSQLQSAYTSSEQALTQSLSVLRGSLDALKQASALQLDKRLLEQQVYIEQIQAKQVWFTLALISISLLMAFYSSARILSPVQKIETLIGELSDKKHQLSRVSHTGPVELIHLERKLHQLAKRLNQLENLRQTMLRHASHELKTPLASIKEGCSLLSENVLGSLNSDQQEVVNLLNTSSMRLESLVSQLLDYNMLLQQTQPNWHAIGCEEFVQAFLTDNQLALQQNDHFVNLKITIDTLYADEILLRRIFDNLLSNAIAYGERQQPICINIYLNKDMQIIEFANSGSTIAEQDKEPFFQPFQRGQKSRHDRVSGAGLGLSIVSECASIMSGLVQFVTVEFADVCVRVSIPIRGETM